MRPPTAETTSTIRIAVPKLVKTDLPLKKQMCLLRDYLKTLCNVQDLD